MKVSFVSSISFCCFISPKIRSCNKCFFFSQSFHQIHGSLGEKSPSHTYESDGEEDSTSSSIITGGTQTPPTRLGDNHSHKTHTPLSIKSEHHSQHNKSPLTGSSAMTANSSPYLGSHHQATSPTGSNSPMLIGHHNHHLLYHQHPNDWYHSSTAPTGDAMNHLNHFSHHHHHLAHHQTTAYWSQDELEYFHCSKLNCDYNSWSWRPHTVVSDVSGFSYQFSWFHLTEKNDILRKCSCSETFSWRTSKCRWTVASEQWSISKIGRRRFLHFYEWNWTFKVKSNLSRS